MIHPKKLIIGIKADTEYEREARSYVDTIKG